LGFLASRTRWLISLCWIAVAVITFFAVDAASFRSWLYLMTVALVPPFVLYGLWHDSPAQTIAEVLRGCGRQ
jgi:hypothetical protein